MEVDEDAGEGPAWEEGRRDEKTFEEDEEVLFVYNPKIS